MLTCSRSLTIIFNLKRGEYKWPYVPPPPLYLHSNILETKTGINLTYTHPLTIIVNEKHGKGGVQRAL